MILPGGLVPVGLVVTAVNNKEGKNVYPYGR